MNQETINYATQDFNLPHDIVKLPTGGIFYNSKKKSVKVGYLTAADEDVIINSAKEKNNSIVLNLIRNKLYEHDLRPEELLDADIEAILIFLRNSSFGPEYKIEIKDPKTDKIFTTTIFLDELEIKEPKYKPDNNGFFKTKLPKSGFDVELRPLKYKDTIELDEMADKYPPGMSAPKTTWRLLRQIVSINGQTDQGEIAKIIQTLPIMDSKYIRDFLNENIPSIDLSRKVKTPSGDYVTVNVTFGVEFFRPFF